MAISLLLKLNFELITHSLPLKGTPSNLEGEFLYYLKLKLILNFEFPTIPPQSNVVILLNFR